MVRKDSQARRQSKKMAGVEKLVQNCTQTNWEIGSFGASEESFDEGGHQTREEISGKNKIIKENDSFLKEEIKKDVDRTYQ